MTDVFISYARQDGEAARTLAHDLQSRGFNVWWDAELVGSDDFTDAIRAALSGAKCAVVSWSKTSINSPFVRDEARLALKQEKLIATRTADLDVESIPLGFQGQHTDFVANREQIVKAIQKLVGHPKGDKNPGKIDDQREYDSAQTLFAAHQYAMRRLPSENS